MMLHDARDLLPWNSRTELHSASLIPGGDLHYHLSQHGVFSEKEMRFYATEIILGLEHMHNRFVVYRDLKVRWSDRFPAFCPTCAVGVVW